MGLLGLLLLPLILLALVWVGILMCALMSGASLLQWMVFGFLALGYIGTQIKPRRR